MNDQSPPQIEIPPGVPLQVTLSYLQWRTLLQLLAEGHHQLRVCGPIYGEIERQCGNELRRVLPLLRPNGEAPRDNING